MHGLWDAKAYAEVKPQVDALILSALETGGKTATELMGVLHENHIGDATSNEQLAMSYSKTGEIFRTATVDLRRRGLMHNSWDLGPKYERPFQYFKGAKPQGGDVSRDYKTEQHKTDQPKDAADASEREAESTGNQQQDKHDEEEEQEVKKDDDAGQ